MSIVLSKNVDGVLYLSPCGRIDSSNAAEAENDVKDSLAAYPHESVVMDLEQLEYISSAGLRVILRLRKSEPSLKMINASPDVYDVFDMTGFTEMIPITKAYRRISVEGCEQIGKGANGVVYRIDRDTIVKVYRSADALPDIQRERELARRAFVLGIPTAIPYDVVKVGDSYGSVFELLESRSLARQIVADPSKLDSCIEVYVELMKKIHSTVVDAEEIPDMREVAIDWAEFLRDYLPQDAAERLVAIVKAVPQDDHMLHGDYHIKNVMLQDGEALLIDMDTLCHGHPIFELASAYNAYQGFYVLNKPYCAEFLGGIDYDMASYIWKRSLSLYLDTDDAQRLSEVEDKAKLMGYTRLLRRLIRRNGFDNEQSRREIEFYKSEIIRLLDCVDTLVF